MKNNIQNFLIIIGGTLVLVGALMQLIKSEYSPYVYTIGALMFAYVQIICQPYDGGDIVMKRLRRQQILGAFLLVVTGVLMQFTYHNEWIVCLTIAAVFELYTAFRMK